MSVKTNLTYDTIAKEFSSGWYNTLALASKNKVDLKSYEFERNYMIFSKEMNNNNLQEL